MSNARCSDPMCSGGKLYAQGNYLAECADPAHVTETALDEFWSEILAGETIPPQATLELNDYAMLLREVPKVYDHVTGGRVSKPNTIAADVIGEADAHLERCIADAVRDELEDGDTDAFTAGFKEGQDDIRRRYYVEGG